MYWWIVFHFNIWSRSVWAEMALGTCLDVFKSIRHTPQRRGHACGRWRYLCRWVCSLSSGYLNQQLIDHFSSACIRRRLGTGPEHLSRPGRPHADVHAGLILPLRARGGECMASRRSRLIFTSSFISIVDSPTRLLRTSQDCDGYQATHWILRTRTRNISATRPGAVPKDYQCQC